MSVKSPVSRGPACGRAHHRSVGESLPQEGFTLIEMVVVVVLLAVLAGVAITSMVGLTASSQDLAATRIRTTLIYAQEWAMGTNNDTWVAFDVAGDLVEVFVEDPGNPGKANRLTMTDPLTRAAMTLQLGSGGVGIDSANLGGTNEVQFDPSGIPYDANGVILAADGTVGVTGGGTIRVTKNTGLVTID